MTSNLNEIQAGWTAYDQSDDKIGEVAEVGQNYVLVQKGLFFPTDLYIPTSHVSSIDADDQSLVINAAKSDVESYGWNSPPTDDGQGITASSDAGWDTADVTQTTSTGYAGGNDTLGTTDTAGTTGTTTTDDSFTVPLREERLEAERREREAGEVSVGTHVVAQEQTLEVPVTHEEVEVTRRRVDRPADQDGGIIDDGTTIRVPLRAEEVDVRKESRVVEEVEISKRPVTETQRVSETVRREEIDVDTSGELVTGAGAGASRSSRSSIDDANVSSGARADDDVTDPYRNS